MNNADVEKLEELQQQTPIVAEGHSKLKERFRKKIVGFHTVEDAAMAALDLHLVPVLERMLEFTNAAGLREHGRLWQPFGTTVEVIKLETMRSFVGVMLYMGLNPQSAYDNYWTQQRGFPKFIDLTDAWSRNRFWKMLSYLRIHDGTAEGADKFLDLSRVYNDTILKHWDLGLWRSFDEACFRNKGRCSLRVRLTSFKPSMSYGIIVRSMNCPRSGLFLAIFVSGKVVDASSPAAQRYLEELLEKNRKHRIVVVADRGYGSVKLAKWALSLSPPVHIVATVRSNRTAKQLGEGLPTADGFNKPYPKRQARGTTEVRVQEVVDSEGETIPLTVTKLNDNTTVWFVETNRLGGRQGEIHRRIETEDGFVRAPLEFPEVGLHYNRHKGGTDLGDQMINSTLLDHRCNRYTMRYVPWLWQVVSYAGYCAFKEAVSAREETEEYGRIPRSFEEYKRIVMLQLLDTVDSQGRGNDTTFKASTEGGGKKCTNCIPIKAELGLRRKCRNGACTGKTAFHCLNCNVYGCLVPKEGDCVPCLSKLHL